MAHKRQDTYTTCKEWAKHLKPYGKRVHNKAERRAAVAFIRELKEESIKQQDFELAASCRDVELGLDRIEKEYKLVHRSIKQRCSQSRSV